jgi:hypothetical protein
VRPQDFVVRPSPVGSPQRIVSEIARPAILGAEAIIMSPEAADHFQEWEPRFHLQSSTDHTNIVSGWLKGQHAISAYDPMNDPSTLDFHNRFLQTVP